MRRVLDIAANDLRIQLRVRGMILNLVVIPIVIAFAVAFANGAGNDPGAVRLRVDVLDADGSDLSAEFLQRIRAANPMIVLCPSPEDEAACGLDGAALDEERAVERLRAETSLALLDIPAGFAESLRAGEPVTVRYRSHEDASAPGYVLQAVQAAARQLGGAVVAGAVGADVIAELAGAPVPGVRERLYADAQDAWAVTPVTVQVVEGAAQPNTSAQAGFQQSIPGIATMYVLFAVLPVMSAFLQERRNWTFQRLLVMPLTRAQVLGGKLLARFALGMIQYAILFAFGLVLGIRYGDNPLGIIVVMVSYTLCVTALALFLMTFVRSEGQASGLSLFLTLTLAPLGGAWWPLEIVPEWMRLAGHISPIAWAMDAYRSLIFYGGGLSDIAVPVLVLLGVAAVLFVLGASRFRYE